jgi:hypothetical protein
MNGGKVHMWACNPSNQNQQWDVTMQQAGPDAGAASCQDLTPRYKSTCSKYKGAFCAHAPNARRRAWAGDAMDNCKATCGLCTAAPTPEPTPEPTTAPTAAPTATPTWHVSPPSTGGAAAGSLPQRIKSSLQKVKEQECGVKDVQTRSQMGETKANVSERFSDVNFDVLLEIGERVTSPVSMDTVKTMEEKTAEYTDAYKKVVEKSEANSGLTKDDSGDMESRVNNAKARLDMFKLLYKLLSAAKAKAEALRTIVDRPLNDLRNLKTLEENRINSLNIELDNEERSRATGITMINCDFGGARSGDNIRNGNANYKAYLDKWGEPKENPEHGELSLMIQGTKLTKVTKTVEHCGGGSGCKLDPRWMMAGFCGYMDEDEGSCKQGQCNTQGPYRRASMSSGRSEAYPYGGNHRHTARCASRDGFESNAKVICQCPRGHRCKTVCNNNQCSGQFAGQLAFVDFDTVECSGNSCNYGVELINVKHFLKTDSGSMRLMLATGIESFNAPTTMFSQHSWLGWLECAAWTQKDKKCVVKIGGASERGCLGDGRRYQNNGRGQQATILGVTDFEVNAPDGNGNVKHDGGLQVDSLACSPYQDCKLSGYIRSHNCGMIGPMGGGSSGGQHGRVYGYKGKDDVDFPWTGEWSGTGIMCPGNGHSCNIDLQFMTWPTPMFIHTDPTSGPLRLAPSPKYPNDYVPPVVFMDCKCKDGDTDSPFDCKNLDGSVSKTQCEDQQSQASQGLPYNSDRNRRGGFGMESKGRACIKKNSQTSCALVMMSGENAAQSYNANTDSWKKPHWSHQNHVSNVYGFCKVSQFKPSEYEKYKDKLNDPNGCDSLSDKAEHSDSNKRECLYLQRASKFFCVDPKKPWRCPIQDAYQAIAYTPESDGSQRLIKTNGILCESSAEKCPKLGGGSNKVADVQHGHRVDFNISEFQCPQSETFWAKARNGIPRNFEHFGAHWLNKVGGVLAGHGDKTNYNVNNDGEYTSPSESTTFNYKEREVTATRTPAAQHAGSELCMLTGSVDQIAKASPPGAIMTLPRWCSPAGCQLTLLPRSQTKEPNGVGKLGAKYTAVQTCSDGAVKLVAAEAGDRHVTWQRPAYMDQFIFSRTPASDDSFSLAASWENVGGKYLYAGVSQHSISGASVCLLTGFITTELTEVWQGPKEIKLGETKATGCTALHMTTEGPVFVATKIAGNEGFGRLLVEEPPTLKLSKDGTVHLVLAESHKFEAGSTVYVSLVGTKAFGAVSGVTDVPISKVGHSVAECYKDAAGAMKEDCQSSVPAAITKWEHCVGAAAHDNAKVHVIGNSRVPLMATICALSGIANFTLQANRPGLVMELDDAQLAGCFPVRAVEHMVPSTTTDKFHRLVIEPQGILRVMPEAGSGAVSLELNLDGVWWNPDFLPQALFRTGRSPAVVFPTPPDVAQHEAEFGGTIDLGECPRKGLIKDAYVFDGDQNAKTDADRSKCGHWIQKRLICTLQHTGGYKCVQMKRLMRTFVFGQAKPPYNAFAQEGCAADILGSKTQYCTNDGVNRLLAL